MSGEYRCLRRRISGCALLAVCLALSGCASIKEKTKRLFAGNEREAVAAPGAQIPDIPIVIEGVDEAAQANILAHLSLAGESCDAPTWRIERYRVAAQEEASSALRALGFYEPEISVDVEQQEACWAVYMAVLPGPQVSVKSVDIRLVGPGAQDQDFVEHLGTLPLRVGDALNHANYDSAKSAIGNFAVQRGYLAGDFETSELRVDVGNREAHAVLVYATGSRRSLGELSIDQREFDDDLIDRLAAYSPGEPYDANDVIALNRRLVDSGYFQSVDVRPRIADVPEDEPIPIDVTLTPRKKHAYSAGAGLTTDAGPRLRLGYENRRLNRRGHRWSARTTFSLIEQDFNAAYRIPLADPRSEWLSFNVGARQFDTDTSTSSTVRFEVNKTKERWGDWLETSFLSVSREDFEVGRQNGISTLVVPGVNFARSVSDDALRPTSGYRLFGEVRGTHESIGSTTSFVRFFGSAGGIRGLPWGGRLLLRTDVGAMQVERFEALPPSQRFFTGGDTTIRGYSFESLGPTDASGDVVGGRFLFVGSIEYEHPIKANWSAAAFVDMGNAFDTSNSNEGLKTGVGVGVRWHSPVGPVRLDLAHPLDDSELVRLHLRLGPDL